MRKTVWILGAAALAGLGAQPAAAAPVACAGGTIDIAATSNSDTPMGGGGTTYNVGQHAIFTAAPLGIAPTSYSWIIPGQHIKDYNEDLGTMTAPPAPVPWGTTPIVPGDLLASSVSLYWLPSAAQTHPSNGPPEARIVTLNIQVGATPCSVSTTVMVERNLTDPNRQPEDYYTSNHPAGTSSTPGFGHVIDEHIYWHQFVNVNPPPGNWRQFLAWHGVFLRRFDEWRQVFGYSEVAPWYPGRRLPTGPEFDQAASLRQPSFNPAMNRIPTYYTLAGHPTPTLPVAADPNIPPIPPLPPITKLADYPDLDVFSDSFEGSYHGDVHCNIGSLAGGFWATSGTGFGSMCKASSPKDPMFWRWHGFIDRLYRNYCALKGLTCHSAAGSASDPWMRDNTADTGAVPSPGPHYVSPDIWNLRAENLSTTCVPGIIPSSLNTVGGVTRDCGTEGDHENPVTGQTNYLYATLRNTGPSPVRNAYAEVVVYIANASTGLDWPADFQMLPESRQFITLNLEPGQVTAIGPLPWTPPTPTPSDHWCIYIRILSVQEAPLVEGPVVDTNVANSNSIAWRNLKIVNPGERRMSSRFIVRNIRRDDQALALDITAAPALLRGGRIVLQLDQTLQRALGEAPQLPDGVRALGRGRFALTGQRTELGGLRLPPRGQGVAEITVEAVPAGATGDIVVTQRSRAGVDGGVTLRVTRPPLRRYRRYR